MQMQVRSGLLPFIYTLFTHFLPYGGTFVLRNLDTLYFFSDIRAASRQCNMILGEII